MKRLVFALCAVVVLASQNVILPREAVAVGKVAQKKAVIAVNVQSIVGMPEQDLLKAYGNPARVEPSEYGFDWYVYNGDLKNFFMAGVRGGAVVAAYSNAAKLCYGTQFRLNATKSTVRGKLGTPISYIRSGNTVCVLNNLSQKDIFAVDSNYVFIFYDTLKGSKVTSMLIVPQADETNALIGHPALSDAVVEAYQRINADLVNSIRVRNGLKRLAYDGKDAALALSRSRDMRDRDYFDHITPAPDKLSPAAQAKNMGIKFKSLGENIAYGDHNAILAHEAFMNSSGHRANILRSKYTKLGVGVACGGSRYVIVTNEFTG
jgi:uncharacterized protein YkwD